jgi:periplasmic divalent cation tolerance protein
MSPILSGRRKIDLASEYIQVFTAISSKQDAERIASHLVGQKLAGCVQVVGPISSTYWWKGKIESAEEWLCIIKTRRGVFGKLKEAVQAVHPYKVPEITAIPIVALNKDYLEWLRSVLVKVK